MPRRAGLQEERIRLLPRLMAWQVAFLALLAGASAPRAPWFALAAWLMLAIVTGKWRLRALLPLAAAFAAGCGVMLFSLPAQPAMPLWAARAGKTVLAEGEVASASGLAGGRVRLLLAHVRPAAVPQGLDAETREKLEKQLGREDYELALGLPKGYAAVAEAKAAKQAEKAEIPGLVALTLDASGARALEHVARPFAGQTVRGAMRFFPSGGSLNEGAPDSQSYWHDRGVWCNARLSRSKNVPLWLEVSSGQGVRHWLEARREAWRAQLAKRLEAPAAESGQIPGQTAAEVQAMPQSRAILMALLFGDRSFLSPRTTELFTQAGLVHSLALSGQHLALAGLAAAACVWLAALFFRSMYLVLPRRVWIGLVSVPFAVFYLCLGGAPFSLLRAACMMGVGVLVLCARRAFTALDALFFAGAVLFFSWPLCLFDLSAQFSFLSVAGILCALPAISGIHGRLAPRRGQNAFVRALRKAAQWAVSLLLVSCAAQMAVMPVQVYVFGTLAPFFLLNLVWLPLLTFITLPCAMLGLAAQVAGGAALSAALLWLAALPARAVLWLLTLLDGMGAMPLVQCIRFSPEALLGAGACLFFCFALAAHLLAHKKLPAAMWRLAACGLCLFLALGMAPAMQKANAVPDAAITVFDVGQAQAVLVEIGSARVLVDGGGSASPFFDTGRSILAPALTYERLPSLDAVAVTHADTDHARGLRWILEHFSVPAMYWSPYSALESGTGESLGLKISAGRGGVALREACAGGRIPLPHGFDLEIVWPPSPQEAGGRAFSRNDSSLVMRLCRNGRGLALLCGDVKASALRSLLKSGADLRAEVLVLPHHGAASSCLPAFYDAVAPRMALASAGAYNQYGFPSRKVREEMARRGIPLHSTGEWGMMRARWQKDGPAELEMPFRPQKEGQGMFPLFRRQ